MNPHARPYPSRRERTRYGPQRMRISNESASDVRRTMRHRAPRAAVASIVVLVGAYASGCGEQGDDASGPVRAPTTRDHSEPRPKPPPDPPVARGAAPSFVARASAINAARQRNMTSWHTGCPVSPSALRIVSLSYWGFDGAVHRGTLVVNHDVVRDVIQAMKQLFKRRFPIRRMRAVEAYGSNDDRSMAADNTSGFNCRGVAGSTGWSQHAYGRAIDINPLENPEVRNGVVSPPAGRAYLVRAGAAKGLIPRAGAAVRAFEAIGWGWGGNWHSLKDYQHFSATGT